MNFTRWIEDYYTEYWHSLGGPSLAPYVDSRFGGFLGLSLALLYAGLLVRGFVTDRRSWLAAWHQFWLPGFYVAWLFRYVSGLVTACRKAYILLRPRPQSRPAGSMPTVLMVHGRPVFLTGLPAALERASACTTGGQPHIG